MERTLNVTAYSLLYQIYSLLLKKVNLPKDNYTFEHLISTKLATKEGVLDTELINLLIIYNNVQNLREVNSSDIIFLMKIYSKLLYPNT